LFWQDPRPDFISEILAIPELHSICMANKIADVRVEWVDQSNAKEFLGVIIIVLYLQLTFLILNGAVPEVLMVHVRLQ
jgi:hypothetical protein